jgi:phosphoglycolate phosphatase
MRPEYELLRRVSHWPDVDVSRESALAEDPVGLVPTVTCADGFHQMLHLFGLREGTKP